MWKYKINLIFNPESVIVMVLDYNNITRLRNNSLIDANGNNLFSLKYLSFNHNKLPDIDSEAFCGMETLILEDNNLYNVFQHQPGVFHPGSQFEGLRYQ